MISLNRRGWGGDSMRVFFSIIKASRIDLGGTGLLGLGQTIKSANWEFVTSDCVSIMCRESVRALKFQAEMLLTFQILAN
jgi:hypothetical protein